MQSPFNSIDRRRTLKLLATGGAVTLAGCTGGEDGSTADTETDDGMDDDSMGDEEETMDDELSSLSHAPQGDPLSEEDIERLVDIFDDQPMNDAQFQVEGEKRSYTPRHIWKWVTEETFIALHFDDPNPEEATALDYVVVGTKGAFTEESQPNEEFSHFHQHTAESWEAGHGGDVGDEGYWLTHFAVRELEYPFHSDPTDVGVDYNFFPTPPEEGSTGTADFEFGGEGSISAADRDALLEVFTDAPMNDDQHVVEGADGEYTPRHVWKWINEETLMFLHFNDPNPEEATELDYFGIGTRGQFDAASRPHEDDFSHFHKHEAESWDAGHGAQSDAQHGYWLAHHSVREIEYPFHDEPIDVGLDRGFFPTPLE